MNISPKFPKLQGCGVQTETKNLLLDSEAETSGAKSID
jgi:hypothetical protein